MTQEMTQFDYRTCTYRKANNPRHITPGDMMARELMEDWADMAECTLTGEMMYRGTTFVMRAADGLEFHGMFYEITCWKCGEKFVDVHWDDPSGAIEICPICDAGGDM